MVCLIMAKNKAGKEREVFRAVREASSRGWRCSRDLKEVRGQMMQKSKERAFRAEESVSAKVVW